MPQETQIQTDRPVQTLERLLEASKATEPFKEAVRALATQQPQSLIQSNPGSPAVKVLRFVMKALEECPELALERVEIHGESGCSSYRGSATAWPGPVKFSFDWDCHDEARKLGWQDPYGYPDQARAARALNYQCFQRFEWE